MCTFHEDHHNDIIKWCVKNNLVVSCLFFVYNFCVFLSIILLYHCYIVVKNLRGLNILQREKFQIIKKKFLVILEALQHTISINLSNNKMGTRGQKNDITVCFTH